MSRAGTSRALPRILGIDPGTVCLGYGVIERAPGTRSPYRYLECGVVRPPKSDDVAARIFQIAQTVDEVIREFQPTAIALEKAFYGKNAASALKLGQVRGALMLLAAQRGVATFEYAPSTIKQQVVGHGRATKAQIQARVQMLFDLQRAPSSDAADALAIALCHGHCAPRSPVALVVDHSTG